MAVVVIDHKCSTTAGLDETWFWESSFHNEDLELMHIPKLTLQYYKAVQLANEGLFLLHRLYWYKQRKQEYKTIKDHIYYTTSVLPKWCE
jgi:hypothetical protein